MLSDLSRCYSARKREWRTATQKLDGSPWRPTMSSSLHKHAIYHREQKGGGWEDGGREPGEHVASSSCVISVSAQDYLLVQS